MKPKVFVVTLAYCNPEILAHGLTRFLMTSGMYPDKYYIVDHHWPVRPKQTSKLIHCLARTVDATVISPIKNLGGHEGFNWAVEWINEKHRLNDEDLICCYDPDTNPASNGWLKDMKEVMSKTPDLLSCSVMHHQFTEGVRNWTYDKVQISDLDSIEIGYLHHPEGYSLSMWRYGPWKKQGGMKGHQFYGHVERLNWKPRNHAYLINHFEGPCPIPHPDSYHQWKLAHALKGYLGNYDQWLAENRER